MQVTKSKPLFRVLLSFILVGAFCLPGFGSAKAAQASEVLPSAEVNPDYASGEIIVVYQNAEEQGASGGFGLLSADEPDPLEATNFEVIEELVDATEETGTIVLAQIPEGETVEEAIEEAESLPGVAYAQPNYHYALMDELSSADDLVDEYEQTLAELLPADALADVVLPTDDSEAAEDTAFGALATTTDPDNNNSIGYGYNQYYLYNTNTNLAWDTARANGTITIAVLDTGTFVNHPDLKANIDTRNMIDMYHAGVRPTPGTPSLISAQVPGGDNVGHGTHVAGILGAVADNGIGIAGTSYNAKILPIKVFDDKASNPSGDTATIIKACQYLKDCIEGGYVSNLRIVNMSLGYHPGSGEAPDTLLEAAIRDLRINYQVLTVCAAGNKGTTDASYPSDYDVSFSVTAVTRSNDRSSYSDYNQYKDISAPGDAIWSTWTGGSYRLDSGTSMASPVVAGIAALVWAAKPALNVDQVVQVLESTATTLPSQPVVSGSKGLVNAGAAVSSATTTTPAAKLALCEVAAIPSQLYTGSSITPQPTVKLGGTTLVLGTDYLLSYYNNTNVGNHTALVTITGRGAYGGQSIKRYFSIYKLTSVAGLSFSILATTQTFTGSALTPSVTIKDGSQTLVLNRDYKLAYANNTNVGTATLTVTGLGTYNGTKQLTFRIISRITRHDGPGRHETAAAASRAAYPSGAQAVVVASSEAFPDALAASSLAGAANAPILLTPSAQLYGATRTELVRLHPSKVYIIGGAGTISPNTYAQIQAALPGVTIKRLGGTTRYETAALIANETVALGGSRSQVFMVAGSNYPDALSVSSVAAYKKIPILLTDTNTLSAPAENFIVSRGIRDVTIVGGTGMVSTGIQNRLPSLGATTVLRASGADRYATALDFTTKAVSKWGLNPTLVGIASGADFPDSLSGGASIGNRGGLLLVTAPTALSNSAKTPLTTFKQRINSVEILGGTGAVTPSTETAIRNLLQ